MSISSKQIRKSYLVFSDGNSTPAKSVSNRNSNGMKSAIVPSARKEESATKTDDAELDAIELDLQRIVQEIEYDEDIVIQDEKK